MEAVFEGDGMEVGCVILDGCWEFAVRSFAWRRDEGVVVIRVCILCVLLGGEVLGLGEVGFFTLVGL